MVAKLLLCIITQETSNTSNCSNGGHKSLHTPRVFVTRGVRSTSCSGRPLDQSNNLSRGSRRQDVQTPLPAAHRKRTCCSLRSETEKFCWGRQDKSTTMFKTTIKLYCGLTIKTRVQQCLMHRLRQLVLVLRQEYNNA